MMFLNKRGEKLMENKLKKELKQILIALGVFLLFAIFDKQIFSRSYLKIDYTVFLHMLFLMH